MVIFLLFLTLHMEKETFFVWLIFWFLTIFHDWLLQSIIEDETLSENGSIYLNPPLLPEFNNITFTASSPLYRVLYKLDLTYVQQRNEILDLEKVGYSSASVG